MGAPYISGYDCWSQVCLSVSCISNPPLLSNTNHLFPSNFYFAKNSYHNFQHFPWKCILARHRAGKKLHDSIHALNILESWVEAKISSVITNLVYKFFPHHIRPFQIQPPACCAHLFPTPPINFGLDKKLHCLSPNNKMQDFGDYY